MDKSQIAVTIVVALVSGGLTPFLVAFVNRSKQGKHLDAQATSITIQSAETTVTILMKTLERTEARADRLEQKLAEREDEIEALKRRLDEMQDTVDTLQLELTSARYQLTQIQHTEVHSEGGSPA